MAHGTPDWGITAGAVTTYQLTDLAELAVRMGSIVSFDRRGEVLFLDTFEDGLVHWYTDFDSDDGAVDLSRAQTRYGPYSARLVAGAGGSRFALIGHRLALPSLSALGLECSFNLPGYVDYFQATINIYDGTYYSIYSVRWDDLGSRLLYTPASGPMVVLLSGQDLRILPTLFHTLKLVVSSDLREYARVILNGFAFDLAGVAAYSLPDNAVPYVTIELEVLGRSGENDTVYVDDVILTQNEPV